MVNVLAKKAVLARLTISRWGARRFDEQASTEVTDKHGATADVGLFTKRLLPKEAMSEIHRIAGEARVLHAKMTLPWLDSGVRIVPTALLAEYMDKMSKLKKQFIDAVNEFIAKYAEHVKKAKETLGTLFNPDDYPDAGVVAAQFAFAINIMPVPDKQDFRVVLDPAMMAEIKRDLEEKVDGMMSSAMAEAATRITQIVGHMAERLKAYTKPEAKPKGKGKKAKGNGEDKSPKGKTKTEGRFRDSLVTNVKELADLLPAFNMNNDPKLADVIKRINRDLCAHDAEALREDANLRQQVRKNAEQIIKDMSAFL